MFSTILLLGLFVGLVIAAITDFQSCRIPNWLTFSLGTFGLLMHTWASGLDGLLFALQGLGLGMACLILFYVKGGMGAGDVKLLGGVGAIIGPFQVFGAFLITAFLGGIYSLCMMGAMGGMGYMWDRVRAFLLNLKLARMLPQPIQVGANEPRLRYALVIGLGTILVQMMDWYDLL